MILVQKNTATGGITPTGVITAYGIAPLGAPSAYGTDDNSPGGGPPPALGLTVYGVSTTVQSQNITIQGQ